MSTASGGKADRWLFVFAMSGARSSHWPWNAFAPPMPTGPTMSGPAPEPICVARASFAPAYGTASNVTWILSWDALNASMTFFSTATCSGASPPPRQQYQRMSTWPGAAVPPAIVMVGAADAPPDAAAGGLLVVDDPHA